MAGLLHCTEKIAVTSSTAPSVRAEGDSKTVIAISFMLYFVTNKHFLFDCTLSRKSFTRSYDFGINFNFDDDG